MTDQPYLGFLDGRRIPQLGLGVWQAPADQTADLVLAAIEAGYRGFDTAKAYGNEAGVGEGVRRSGLPRDDLFVTTKLFTSDHGFDEALKAFDDSLGRLGLDHVDLYLIHWPAPAQNKYLESWKALVRLMQDGRARSIGVSNFQPTHLERIIGETGVAPVLNQVELHPKFQQKTLREVHGRLGIVTECWSPLGHGRLLGDPVIGRIAARNDRSPAQVMLRWHIENGLRPIPKSANPRRIAENFDIFDFHLSGEDEADFAALDDPAGRQGPDPDRFG